MPFKNKSKVYSALRDDPQGAVMLIPHIVLNSPAYKTLSGNAIRLLIDIAMQFNGKTNNGALLASWRYMSTERNWTSAGSLSKALNELLEHRLICKTVQGHRPNKASWFAVCWSSLQVTKGIDITVNNFPRGSYKHWLPPADVRPRRKMPIPKRIVNKYIPLIDSPRP